MNNNKFTKKDLKTGYLVEMRDGSLNMVMEIQDKGRALIDRNDGWMPLSSYTDDLRVESHPSYDIVAVYGFSTMTHAGLKLSRTEGRRELLWKRESKKTCDICIHKPVCNHIGICEHFAAKK